MDRFVLMARWFVKKYSYSVVFLLFSFTFFTVFDCFYRNSSKARKEVFSINIGPVLENFKSFHGSDWFRRQFCLPFLAAPSREFTAI